MSRTLSTSRGRSPGYHRWNHHRTFGVVAGVFGSPVYPNLPEARLQRTRINALDAVGTDQQGNLAIQGSLGWPVEEDAARRIGRPGNQRPSDADHSSLPNRYKPNHDSRISRAPQPVDLLLVSHLLLIVVSAHQFLAIALCHHSPRGQRDDQYNKEACNADRPRFNPRLRGVHGWDFGGGSSTHRPTPNQ